MKYNFCLQCAGKLDPKRKVPFCSNCNIHFYKNSKPTVGAIIYNEKREVLLSRRALPPVGKVDIIGGFLEDGEDPIEGIKREVREEIGCEICVGEIIGIYIDGYMDDKDTKMINIQYATKIISGTPKPKDELESVEWFKESDLNPRDFAFKNTGWGLRDFFKKFNSNP